MLITDAAESYAYTYLVYALSPQPLHAPFCSTRMPSSEASKAPYYPEGPRLTRCVFLLCSRAARCPPQPVEPLVYPIKFRGADKFPIF